MGRIITFYSYKGGTGRSMALANVAWALASHNHRVLVVDWDLEAPGLHRYFRPFLVDPELTAPESTGLIDFVRSFADRVATPQPSTTQDQAWHAPYADVRRWGIPLRTPEGPPLVFGTRGEIRLLPAGRQDSEYPNRVNSFGWDRFYLDQSGGAFFEAVRASMRSYDYVLIDSRTGVSDTSGICTIQMPDVVAVCYTYNIQSIEGASKTAAAIQKQRPDMAIFPVAMRAEYQQEPMLTRMRALARKRFQRFVEGLETSEDYFDQIEVPYLSQYAYWERLSAFDDRPASKSSINTEMARLAHFVSGEQIGVVPAGEELKRQCEAFNAQLTADEPGDVTDVVRMPAPRGLPWWTLAAGLAAALVAFALPWSLWQHPSPGAERAKLVAAAVESAPLAAKIGVLVDSRTADTPETRALYTSVAAKAIPTLQLELTTKGFYRTEVRLDPSGRHLLTCDNALTLWSVDGALEASSAALDPRVEDCAFVSTSAVYAMWSGTLDRYEWTAANPRSIQRTARWDVSRVAPGFSTAFAVSPDARQVALVGIESFRIVRLDDSGSVTLLDEVRFGAAPNFLLTATSRGFAFVEGGLSPRGRQVTVTTVPYSQGPPATAATPRQAGRITTFKIPDGTTGHALSESGDELLTFDDSQLIVLGESGARKDSVEFADLGSSSPAVDPTAQWLVEAGAKGVQLRSRSKKWAVTWSTGTIVFDNQPFASVPVIREVARDGTVFTASAGPLGSPPYSVFRTDRQLPSADAAWSAIVSGLRGYTSLCMQSDDRQRVFYESAEEATAGFYACETAQGRRPIAPSPPASPAPAGSTPPTTQQRPPQPRAQRP